MRLNDYIRDQWIPFIINIIGLILMSLYLLAIGVSLSQILILLIGWIFVLFIYLYLDFRMIKTRYDLWEKAFNQLDKKYLITELIQKPVHFTDKLFYNFLRKANKAMMEEINQYKINEKEYEEYIEQWVHEMKTPISAISLICANSDHESSQKIIRELKKINNLVSQTLFFAKSEMVHHDLFITKVDLNEIIHHVILDNKLLLQENKFNLKIDDSLPIILSDKKWLTYVFNQIILNSIKYTNKENPYLKISSTHDQNKIIISIEDNGVGITPSDLPRVFDKGFTGQNRSNQQSTGLGLYLSKNLCSKLNIDLTIESVVNQYTRVFLNLQNCKDILI